MATGRQLGPRVAALLSRMKGFGPQHLADLVTEAQTEIYDIVKITLGFTNEQMDELAYEDLFTLTDAVVNVCIVRRGANGDVEGAGGKLLALAGLRPDTLIAGAVEAARRLQNRKTETSPPPSSSSSPPATPTTEPASTP